MSMEEKAALAELRQMIRQLTPERKEEFEEAYTAISDYHAAHGNLGIVAMNVYLLEQAT